MEKFQLKISLQGSKPPIWRRVIVDSGLFLSELHFVIQTVMPWENCHLHQFIKDEMFYGEPDEYSEGLIDYGNIRVCDLLDGVKKKIIYEYDFGDSWMHDIVLEKILPASEMDVRAKYVTGKGACPLEDSGGIYMYNNVLKILKNPDHEQYEDMLEMMCLEEDDDFDPTEVEFTPKEINEDLQEIFK